MNRNIFKIITACTILLSGVNFLNAQNEGQIKFNKETTPNEKTASVFFTEFNSDEDITAFIYMVKPVQSYDIYDKSTPDKPISAIEKKYFFKYFINGVDQQIGKTGDALSGRYDGLMAFTVKVLRKSGIVSHNDFRNKVLKLSGGKYKIRLEMWGGTPDKSTKEPIVKGEFTLNKIEFVGVSTGKYANIKAGMTNAPLEQQALKVLTAHATSEAWAEKFSKPKIISADWEIVRQEWPKKILHRSINVVMYAIFPNGKCKASYFSFKQEYDGSKYSNNLQFNGVGPTDIVDCD